MTRLTRASNALLASLPPADFALLAPHLQAIPLKPDEILARSGDFLSHIYFPEKGAVAFMVDMPSGQMVATALVGREGAVGSFSVLGLARSPITAIVRVGGIASRISASRFQSAFAASPSIQQAVLSHIRALFMQFQHVSACNALHSVDNRTARWLLHIHDHTEGDRIPVTQETLAHLLGVRRTTVTLIVRKLRSTGAIKSDQRGLIEIDRQRLEAASCDCYAMLRHGLQENMPAKGSAPRLSLVPGRRD